MINLDQQAQDAAVERLQRHLWRLVVDRFEACQRAGLRRSDLARRLEIAKPQVHVWLTDPSKITLKAAARLMWAMDGQFDFMEDPQEAEKATPSPQASDAFETRLIDML